MNRMALLGAAAALLLTPLAQPAAQSGGSGVQDTIGDTDQVTFYGHIFGHGLVAPMPSNTEAPVGENNYGLGTFDWCTPQGSATGILPPNPRPGTSCEDNEWHKLALFSTAGFVDVTSPSEFDQEGGYGLLHNERGQTKNVQLDQGESITADVFLTVDYHGWPVGGGATHCLYPHPPNLPCMWPYWGWDAGVQPNFVTKATLYQADLGDRSTATEAPPVQEALQSGDAEVVAQGQWGPSQAMTGLPGSPNALQVDIDLGSPDVSEIPKENDFFLVYETYSETAAGDVGIHSVRWWSGEFFPPTFTMPVKNAFTVERVIPNFVHGKLALLGIINTPWGSYDVDPETVELTVESPTGATVNTEHLNRFADFSVAHGGHFKPVNITWVWDYQRENLDPGKYTVTVSATNFQHSAAAQCTASFTLEENANGQMVQGDIEEGVCGTQSTTQEDLDDLQAEPEGGS